MVAALILLGTPAAAGSAPSSRRGHGDGGNWVWYYQQIAPADAAKFSGATAVVTTTQKDTAEAVATIHRVGALAFSYLNVYWLPLGRAYDGVDIAQHPDWQFCDAAGNTLMGRSTGTPGRQSGWVYPDLNERGMHDALLAYLQGLKASGYDGVFFDRGTVALGSGPMPGLVSGCTTDPITPGATFADAYARIVRDASAIGLRVALNYTVSPPLRPDVASVVDRVLQEDAPRSRADLASVFARRQLESKSTPRYVEEVKTTRPGDRAGAFLGWAEVGLWSIDIDINTGDNNCVGVPITSICYHDGTFPELTRVRRGAAITPNPTRSACYRRSATACLWVRRWSDAVVAANERLTPVRTTISLGAKCQRVRDIWANKPIAAGRCVRRFRITIPPQTGRVYQTTPR